MASLAVQSATAFALATEALYRLVAASRTLITIVYRIWHGRELKPPTYHISSTLFLRLLGVVYLIAFVSLWTQIDGWVSRAFPRTASAPA